MVPICADFATSCKPPASSMFTFARGPHRVVVRYGAGADDIYSARFPNTNQTKHWYVPRNTIASPHEDTVRTK